MTEKTNLDPEHFEVLHEFKLEKLPPIITFIVRRKAKHLYCASCKLLPPSCCYMIATLSQGPYYGTVEWCTDCWDNKGYRKYIPQQFNFIFDDSEHTDCASWHLTRGLG